MMRIASIIVVFASVAHVGYSAAVADCAADKGNVASLTGNGGADLSNVITCAAGKAFLPTGVGGDNDTSAINALGDWQAKCCTNCAAGTFNATPGLAEAADACSACPNGHWSDAGEATECTACVAGKFFAGAGTAIGDCTDCAAGKFSATAGATECTTCDAGSWSGAGETSCTKCVAGKFLATAGTAIGDCTDCAAGKFSATAGSTECETCAAGTFSGAGDTTCATCNPLAEDCPIGSGLTCDATGNGTSTCTECAEGTYSDVADKTSLCKASSAVKVATGLTSLLAVLLLLL